MTFIELYQQSIVPFKFSYGDLEVVDIKALPFTATQVLDSIISESLEMTASGDMGMSGLTSILLGAPSTQVKQRTLASIKKFYNREQLAATVREDLEASGIDVVDFFDVLETKLVSDLFQKYLESKEGGAEEAPIE